MDSHSLSLLGFDRIQNMVALKTQTVFGKEIARQIQPLDSVQAVENELDLVEECLNINDEISLSGVVDLRPHLSDISSDTILTPEILRDTQKTLEAIRKINEFFVKRKDSVYKIYHITKNIITDEALEKSINKAIDEFGEIKSDATPKLKKIRSEITKQRNEIIRKLEKITAANNEFLQDTTIVIKHNRYCLPLKVESQKKIPGILHEFSPNAKTIFIEPLSLVDSQNDLAQLKDEEKNEVERILAALSKAVFNICNELLTDFHIIGRLDELFAKRRFAIQFNCTRPTFSNDAIIRIIKGVHPLLTVSKPNIVPLDLIFPKDINVILISGPNAGGKTVVLKTVGLFSLMFLSGLYLPANKGTELPFFNNVFADIGDDQSIDSNLSSFSAHILKLTEILRNADNKSLILLDEIGSSTAPEEGSALAIAVLEDLCDRGSYCIATSHFNPLKAFIQDAPKMVNAAMEFTTHPTYHFMIGFPGSSSALEISKELGFPENLIERAKTFLDKDWLKLSERLKSLASETEKTIMLNDKLTKARNELELIKNDYTSKLKNFKKFEQDEKQKILVESKRFFSEHRRNIENLIRKIKESNAEKQTIVEAKNYVTDQLNSIKDTNLDEKLTAPINQNQSFEIGDTIFSKTFQKQGVIVDKTNLMATIAFGSIKFELDYDDLEHAQDEKNEQKVAPTISQTTQTEQIYHQLEVAIVLNIIGQHREEAMISVQRFLDDAASNHIHEVSIIHGKGKGILKDMLWDMLRNDPHVVQFRFGEPFEGGIGMTKIELR